MSLISAGSISLDSTFKFLITFLVPCMLHTVLEKALQISEFLEFFYISEYFVAIRFLRAVKLSVGTM
jgi:hypothetical protein